MTSQGPFHPYHSQHITHQKIAGHDTVCLLEPAAFRKVPAVAPPTLGIAGQISGRYKRILYAAERCPFCIWSFLIVLWPIFGGHFSRLHHIICCLSNTNSDNISILPWDWSMSTTIASSSVVTTSSGDMKVCVHFPYTTWPWQLWDFRCSCWFDCLLKVFWISEKMSAVTHVFNYINSTWIHVQSKWLKQYID